MNLSPFLITIADSLLSPKAYIDPNTGGMLFQVLAGLLAVFSGILFFFSRQIRTLFARIKRKSREKEEPTPEDSANLDADEKS